MKTMKALIVDDSFIMVKKITKIIESIGMEVVSTAKTGKQAIIQYENHKPDFVTMDITMPNMDGITATREILSHDPNAIIIMVTSHGQQLLVIDAIKAGAKGYLLKPLEEKKTQETIVNTLRKYKEGYE